MIRRAFALVCLLWMLGPVLAQNAPGAQGPMAPSSAAPTRSSLGAAAAGANSDITSLSGLTAPIPQAGIPAFSGGDVTSPGGSLLLSIVNGSVTASKLAPGAAAANLTFAPLNPAANLADVAAPATARANLNAAASGLNNDITALFQGAPQVVSPQDFNPAVHLAHFMATPNPRICFIGDSTTTYLANNVAPTDLLANRIWDALVRGNQNKTVTVGNYAIGGSTITNFNQVFTPSQGFPGFWTDHNQTWGYEVGQQPPCTSIFLNWGVNGPGSFTISALTGVLNTIVGYGWNPDIVIITNNVANPSDGNIVDTDPQYQAGFRANAGMARTFAHNVAQAGVAGIPPIGLIDVGLFQGLAVLGEDPTHQVLTIDPTVANASISALPYTFATQADGDFDLQFTISDPQALYAAGYGIKVTLADLLGSNGLGATSGGTFVLVRSTNGSNCTMNYYGGNQSSKPVTVGSGWSSTPATPMTFRITAEQDHLQMTCNGSLIGDIHMPRIVGPFYPSFDWFGSGTTPAETITITQYAHGVKLRTLPVMTYNDFWGALDGSGPTGGNGSRHATSKGLNRVIAPAIGTINFGAVAPIFPNATGLTSIGTNQATALPLPSTTNQITSSPAGTGVALPVGIDNERVVVSNADPTNNPLSVYPLSGSGASINAGLANASISIPAGQTWEFYYISPTMWLGSPLANTQVSSTRLTKWETPGSYTYTPTPGMVAVDFFLFGGGGGGGGGALQAASASCSGGAGGGGGGRSIKHWSAAQIGASRGLAVGAGGTAGLAATASSTAGSPGGDGVTTTLSGLQSGNRGCGGAGGQLAGTSGGGGGGGIIGQCTTGSGTTAGLNSMGGAGGDNTGTNAAANYSYGAAAGGGGGGSGTLGGAGGNSSTAGGGGGAGGGISPANAVFAGGLGGFALTGVGILSRGAAGAAGAVGGAGDAGVDMDSAGAGGGGGGSDLTAAGAGGAGGGHGGAGGGGGCAQNGGTAGPGGGGGGGAAYALERF